MAVFSEVDFDAVNSIADVRRRVGIKPTRQRIQREGKACTKVGFHSRSAATYSGMKRGSR